MHRSFADSRVSTSPPGHLSNYTSILGLNVVSCPLMEVLKKNLKKIVAVAAIVIVGLVFFKLRGSKNDKKVETAKVQRGNLSEALTISGSIDADERVVLRFQTAGRLSYVGVKKGDTVKKGQLIAALDQRSVKKNLQKELNDFVKSRDTLDETRDTYDGVALTDTIRRALASTQYDVNNAVIDVELQQLAIEYSSLTSPISGIVTAVTSPYAGVNITTTQAEFEIINPTTVYFTANADQTEVTQLHEGMEGKLILDSFADKTLHGKIDTIAYTPTAGETGTVYAVKFVITDPSETIYRIGMTGDVSFITQSKKDILYVPIKFVKEDNGTKYVTVEKKGKQIRQTVTTGIETDNNIELTSGLSLGDIVYD